MCWLLLFLCIIYDCTSDSRETATKPALSKVSKFHKECRSWFHVMLFITTQRFIQIPKSLIQRGEITVTEFHSYLITDIWMQSRLGNGFNTPFLQDPPRIVFWFSTGSQKTKKQSVIRMHSCRLVTAPATVSACDLLCWKLSWPWWDYWGSISWNGRRKQR